MGEIKHYTQFGDKKGRTFNLHRHGWYVGARVDYGWNAYADHRTAHSLPADFFATVSHARSGHDARVADLNRRAESLDVLCGKGIDGEDHIGPRQGNHFVYQFCGFKPGYAGDRGVETAHI